MHNGYTFASGIVTIRKLAKNHRMQIGFVIRLIRKAKRLTLEDVAHAAGTTASYLSRIEMDKNQPSSELLDNVAAALGVSVANIYAEAEMQIGKQRDKFELPALDVLTKQQKHLLQDYESLDGRGRELVDVLIKTLKKQAKDFE